MLAGRLSTRPATTSTVSSDSAASRWFSQPELITEQPAGRGRGHHAGAGLVADRDHPRRWSAARPRSARRPGARDPRRPPRRRRPGHAPASVMTAVSQVPIPSTSTAPPGRAARPRRRWSPPSATRPGRAARCAATRRAHSGSAPGPGRPARRRRARARGQVGHLRLGGQPQLGLAATCPTGPAQDQRPVRAGGPGRRAAPRRRSPAAAWPAAGGAQHVPVAGHGDPPERAAPGQLPLGGDPVIGRSRRHGGGLAGQAAARAARRAASGAASRSSSDAGRRARVPAGGLGDLARARGDEQPAAVGAGDVPAAGHRLDPVAGRRRRRAAAAGPVDPQHARPPARRRAGGPARPPGALAGGAPAARRCGQPSGAAGAQEPNVHSPAPRSRWLRWRPQPTSMADRQARWR